MATGPVAQGGRMTVNSEVRINALSGVAWSAIAWGIGHEALGTPIWGGVLASPFIGVLIGRMSRRHHEASWIVHILVSFFHLYFAAMVFAVATSILGVAWRPVPVSLGEWVLQVIFVVLWGLTFTGYVIVLWPLSFLNHWIVWRTIAGSAASGTISRL
jgi:hypothetical protein